MQNFDLEKTIDSLKSHWQLLAFGVFLLGFVTFSFYMQINGFSFVLPDLKFLISFGLIVFLICIPLIVVAHSRANWFIAIAFWGLIPSVFMQSPASALTALITAVVFIDFISDYFVEPKKIEKSQKAKTYIDKFLLLFVLPSAFLMTDWQLGLLLVANIMFFIYMQSFYIRTNSLNIVYVFVYILIVSYLTASLANQRGLTIANMGKNSVQFQTDDNITVNGLLVFEDNNACYIKMGGKNISIAKSNIKSAIEYIEYKQDNNENLTFYKLKKAFASI